MVWPIQQPPSRNMLPRQEFFSGGSPQQTSSGGVQNLLSPEKISGFSQKLSNVQQVLNVVQSAAPIIQQYGPMVKNMPALLKMMKVLNESDSETDNNSEDHEDHIKSDHTEELELPDSYTEETTPSENNNVYSVNSGESMPKLFI